jgi:hypothetical protein
MAKAPKKKPKKPADLQAVARKFAADEKLDAETLHLLKETFGKVRWAALVKYVKACGSAERAVIGFELIG